MSQHMDALDRANECRLKRAQLKREVQAGDVRLSETLSEVHLPDWLEGERVGRMLRWLPRWGPRRVRDLLAELRINELRTAGDLTYRQRRGLAAVILVWEQEQVARSGRRAHPQSPGLNGGRV
jgi:hypothetical protein